MIGIPVPFPDNCAVCPLSVFDTEFLYYFCPLVEDDVTALQDERHPDCIIKKVGDDE